MIAGNLAEIRLPKTFSVLYLRKSNYLNQITGDHANENYEVNMWGKYCRIYPEFAQKTNNALLMVQPIYEN